MKTQNINLEYFPQYNAFGIKDEVIEEFAQKQITPIISLKAEDYSRLNCPVPQTSAPTVAFLLGREKDCYTIDMPYAKAIAQSGVQIRFLTYKENISQMSNTDGLILPGGAFNSPNEFYTDPLKKGVGQPGTRSYAYITSIMEAEKQKMPMLGICAGAQMIGGMHGMKMYRNVKEYTNTAIEHKTKNTEAHEITIFPDTPLFNLIGKNKITTNSRHTEAMLPNDKISDLEIYANSYDSIPEAWGNAERHILCIQWHPEDFASQGDTAMQNIYNWLAKEAHIHQKQKELQQKSIKIPTTYNFRLRE